MKRSELFTIMIILIIVAFSCAQLADSTDVVEPVIPQPQVIGVDTVDVVIIYYGSQYGSQTLLAYALGYAVTTQYAMTSQIASETTSSTSLYTPDGQLVNQDIVHQVKVLTPR